jgi:hypothetical protein
MLNCDDAEAPVQIEIHGDFIAILIRSCADYCFFLVAWKEGTVLLVSEPGQ